MKAKILEFFRENKIKYRISGNEAEIGCLVPECPNNGQSQMYVNLASGAWYCHRCNSRGANLSQLAYKAGILQLKEPNEQGYTVIPDSQVMKWHTDLFNKKEAITYLKEQRGFKDSAIRQFLLGYKEEPQGPVITIPYFDTNQLCVGFKKYYYTNPIGVPKIKFEKGSKIQLYNINCVDLEEPLIVTEGEFDAITAWQYGYKNVGSIPNGVNGLQEEWIEEIYNAPSFILCFDYDKAGNLGAKQLAEKLGLSKCFRAFPRLKDLNEYAKCGVSKKEVDIIFQEKKPFFTAPVTSITQYLEEAKEMLANPEKAKGVSTGWSSLDNYIGGIRTKEVTVASGLTGHGKTTFTEALIGNINQNMKSLIISPEMQESDILVNLANNYHSSQITKTSQLDDFVNYIQNRVEIVRVYDAWTNRKEKDIISQTFDLIQHASKHKNVKFVMIDHLHLFINPSTTESERQLIDRFMRMCVHNAVANDIHIWLIVQPRGLPANQRKVTIHDLKGSSAIGQDTHNILLIHRNTSNSQDNDLVEIEIGKNRKFGLCGSFTLKFDVQSKANYYVS